GRPHERSSGCCTVGGSVRVRGRNRRMEGRGETARSKGRGVFSQSSQEDEPRSDPVHRAEVGMSKLAMAPPYSPIEPVTEVLHGLKITDPYRWLEDQDSPRTREWLVAQREYTRWYLDAIPGRDCIRKRIRELLDVETHDSIQKAGQRYFFRKRL